MRPQRYFCFQILQTICVGLLHSALMKPIGEEGGRGGGLPRLLCVPLLRLYKKTFMAATEKYRVPLSLPNIINRALKCPSGSKNRKRSYIYPVACNKKRLLSRGVSLMSVLFPLLESISQSEPNSPPHATLNNIPPAL
jgi:hypothetical protein